jgi:hypothetical protein
VRDALRHAIRAALTATIPAQLATVAPNVHDPITNDDISSYTIKHAGSKLQVWSVTVGFSVVGAVTLIAAWLTGAQRKPHMEHIGLDGATRTGPPPMQWERPPAKDLENNAMLVQVQVSSPITHTPRLPLDHPCARPQHAHGQYDTYHPQASHMQATPLLKQHSHYVCAPGPTPAPPVRPQVTGAVQSATEDAAFRDLLWTQYIHLAVRLVAQGVAMAEMGGEQHWQQASPEQQIMALERALTHPTVLGLEITQLTRPKSEQLQSVGYKGKQEVWLLRTGNPEAAAYLTAARGITVVVEAPQPIASIAALGWAPFSGQLQINITPVDGAMTTAAMRYSLATGVTGGLAARATAMAAASEIARLAYVAVAVLRNANAMARHRRFVARLISSTNQVLELPADPGERMQRLAELSAGMGWMWMTAMGAQVQEGSRLPARGVVFAMDQQTAFFAILGQLIAITWPYMWLWPEVQQLLLKGRGGGGHRGPAASDAPRRAPAGTLRPSGHGAVGERSCSRPGRARPGRHSTDSSTGSAGSTGRPSARALAHARERQQLVAGHQLQLPGGRQLCAAGPVVQDPLPRARRRPAHAGSCGHQRQHCQPEAASRWTSSSSSSSSTPRAD